MDKTDVELPQAGSTELVQEKAKSNVFTSFLRRVLGSKKEVQTKAPQVSLEQLQQDLTSLEEMRVVGGKDFNTPQTRAQDDARIEQLKAAIASRTTPKPQVETKPTTVVPLAPNQPVEEPKAA